MVERVQRFVVGPLQVVQHQHQRLRGGKQLQATDPGVQAAALQLLAVAQDAGDEGAGAVVQADELAQQRSLLVGRVTEDRPQRGGEGRLRFGLRGAVPHAQLPEQQVAQQAVGLVSPLEVAAGAPQGDGLRLRRQQGLDFCKQAALAQAGIADDGGRTQPAAGREHGGCQALQPAQFVVAADHGRGHAVGAMPQAAQAPFAHP